MSGLSSIITSRTFREQAVEFLDGQKESAFVTTLSLDTILFILSGMDLRNISSLSLSCKAIHVLAKDNSLWRSLFYDRFSYFLTIGKVEEDFCLRAYREKHLIYENQKKGVYASRHIKTHEGRICSLAVAKDKIISGTADRKIRVWDLETGVCLNTLEGHEGAVFYLGVVEDTLISGSFNNTVKFWDLPTGDCTRTLEGKEGAVIALLNEGNRLFCGSLDNAIRIWDIRSGECLNTMIGHSHWVNAFVISGNTLCSGSYDHTIKVWDVNTGVCLKTLEGHTGWIYTLAIKEGKLISGSSDKTIKVWDLESGTCLDTLKRHRSGVRSIRIVGDKFISSSSDKKIMVWDFETRSFLYTLTGHKRGIYALASMEGAFISGSSDKTIRLWDFSASDEVIFQQIADSLRENDSEGIVIAMDRFNRMPKSAKNRVYDELFKILHFFANGDRVLGEYAFHGVCGESSTSKQKAQAIENYLRCLQSAGTS